MTIRSSEQFGGNNRSPLGAVVGILVGILFLIALFSFVQFLFNLLWYVLPVIVIATAIIDYKVILNYFGWVGKLFKRNIIYGLLIAVLTIVAAPVVGLFLLGKALLRKKVKEVTEEVERQKQGEFVEYEEIDSETLELPPLEPPVVTRRPDNSGEYDDMFK
jgi:hypothetical protein